MFKEALNRLVDGRQKFVWGLGVQGLGSYGASPPFQKTLFRCSKAPIVLFAAFNFENFDVVSCLIGRAFRAFGLRVEATGQTAPFRGPLAALLHVRAGCAGSGGLSYIILLSKMMRMLHCYARLKLVLETMSPKSPTEAAYDSFSSIFKQIPRLGTRVAPISAEGVDNQSWICSFGCIAEGSDLWVWFLASGFRAL